MNTVKDMTIPVGYDNLGQIHHIDFFHTPKILLHSRSQFKLSHSISSLLHTLCTNTSPEEIEFCSINFSDAFSLKETDRYPQHFYKPYTESDIDAFFTFLDYELHKRQKFIPDSSPILFVLINRIDLLSDENKIIRILELFRLSRCLGIYFISTSMTSDLKIQNFFDLNFNLNQIKKFYYKDIASASSPAHASASSHTVWSWSVYSDSGELKTLQLAYGNLCKLQKECDLVVCSAFKNDYIPTPTSLIGALYNDRQINVQLLAQHPQLDFRSLGCWMSHDTGTAFKRIACVELLDYWKEYTDIQKIDIILKKAFSTLYFMLDQASIASIPIQTVALPILGAGDEQIDTPYILSTLISQCHAILHFNSGVKKIIFYELNFSKFEYSAHVLNNIFHTKERPPLLFLSYSSKQSELAREIYNFLIAHNLSCWMAPDSIPPGSSYMEMIPLALSQVKIVLLLLTPDAEKSRWVQKEIGTAIGSDKFLIPYQPESYPISPQFQFILDGEQILVESENPPSHRFSALLHCIQKFLEKK